MQTLTCGLYSLYAFECPQEKLVAAKRISKQEARAARDGSDPEGATVSFPAVGSVVTLRDGSSACVTQVFVS
jgi:hypothetical protein